MKARRAIADPQPGWRCPTARRGFTRTELLVVLAMLAMMVLAVLVAFIAPAIGPARLRASAEMMLLRGKEIYGAWHGNSTQAEWPKAGPLRVADNQFPDSTEFFRMMVTGGVMKSSFAFFAGPGVHAASGNMTSEFRSENNAWSITAGLDDGSHGLVPFIMLRNVEIRNLNQPVWDGSRLRIGSATNGRQHLQPFGARAFAFVTKDGSGYRLSGSLMNPQVFTNLFWQQTNDRPILHPWP
jgi:hypothetical protein